MAAPVIQTLAALYRRSQAGRTGQASNDFTADFRDLLKAAQATDGDARERAVHDLLAAVHVSNGRLSLDVNPRDENLIRLVRLSRTGGEQWLFDHLGEPSPSRQRETLAALFSAAPQTETPARWGPQWQTWCQTLADKALRGESISPFSRDDLDDNRELLRILVRLLSWEGESYLRFASCAICGDSKTLGKREGALVACLEQITGGAVVALDDLGLLPTPRRVVLHGPLVLKTRGGTMNLGLLRGPVLISELDLNSVVDVQCTALRVLTVENDTTFHELSKRNSETLLIQTSFPGRAVLHLLRLLPDELPSYHFGDTDPAGYDILRDLRERAGRPFLPLHMGFRDKPGSRALLSHEPALLERLLTNPAMADCHAAMRAMKDAARAGDFEQESLGVPQGEWPFYQSLASL